METVQNRVEHPTFETVWAALQENDRQIKEDREQMRELRERFKETEKFIDSLGKKSGETERLMKENAKFLDNLGKQVGGLHRSLGELIETLIAARLWEKFKDYPYNLCRHYQRVYIYDEKNRAITDVDILLADSEWVMAVEVKRELDKKDIEYHLERMERIRKYPPAEVVGKKLLGAIAGGVVEPDVHKLAYKAGFFSLELTGESVALVPPPEGFTPKIW